jgi:23S rRNA (cytosine1962-C5)-methyltransferase
VSAKKRKSVGTTGSQAAWHDAPVAAAVFQQRSLAPDPAAGIPAVFLRSATWHPLLYRKRIARHDTARPGDLVAIYVPGDELLGYGVYNPRSEIAVRMLFPGPDLPDDARWQQKLDEAIRLRRDLLRLDAVTNAYRVIHAEADGLSGLVVDRLGETLSAEAFSLGMYQRVAAILARLAVLCGTRHTLLRPSPQFLSQEGFQPPEIASPGLPEEVTIREFGTRFRVRFASGHKTGFFCDQRENRRRLAMRLVAPGGLLLSCTCSGLLSEADFVSLLCAPARQAGPAMAGTTGETPERHAPRPMQILARSGAAADHPIAASVPETEYLKAVWMRLG